MSSAAWLNGAGGSRNDNVSIFAMRADANAGGARTATLTVVGHTIPVLQAAGTTASTSPGPTITSMGIVNGASFQNGGLAPGEIISIFGKNLGPDTPATVTVAIH